MILCRNQSLEPQQRLQEVLDTCEAWKKMKELAIRFGNQLQTFDLPTKATFLEVAREGSTIGLDCLHFTSGTQAATVALYGLRGIRTDQTKTPGLILHCRDYLYLLWQELVSKGLTSLDLEAFLQRFVMANSLCHQPPHNSKGKPYDFIAKAPITDADVIQLFESNSEEVYSIQLQVTTEIAISYGLNPIGMFLGGRGIGATDGYGGSHLARLKRALSTLSTQQSAMLVAPERAAWHPSAVLSDLSWMMPPRQELDLINDTYVKVLIQMRLLRPRFRVSGLNMFATMYDTNVSYFLKQG